MQGDGNCLFRSIAHQVYGNAELHEIVRAKIMHYIQNQPGYFANFVDGPARTLTTLTPKNPKKP